MTEKLMRCFWIGAVAAIFVSSCERPPEPVEVKVEDAWVRLPAAPGRPGSAYFTLRTNSVPMKFVGISSPRVDRIELHESGTSGTMTRMIPIPNMDFPATRELAFAPGGKHAMLFGIDSALKPGDRLSLSFRFEPGLAVTAEAEVRGPGGMPDVTHAGH